MMVVSLITTMIRQLQSGPHKRPLAVTVQTRLVAKRNDYTEPEPVYYCGAQHCDDPACGTHGSDWADWRRDQ